MIIFKRNVILSAILFLYIVKLAVTYGSENEFYLSALTPLIVAFVVTVLLLVFYEKIYPFSKYVLLIYLIINGLGNCVFGVFLFLRSEIYGLLPLLFGFYLLAGFYFVIKGEGTRRNQNVEGLT